MHQRTSGSPSRGAGGHKEKRISTTDKKEINKTDVPVLKSYHEVPPFLQHNRHILTGYRVYYRSLIPPHA